MRLAASFQIAANAAGLKPRIAAALPGIVATSYQSSMANFAGMSDLDVWYYRIDTALLMSWARETKSSLGIKAIQETERAATAKDRWSAVKSLTTIVDGERVFKDQPPLLARIPVDDERRQFIGQMYADYCSTLLVDRAELLSRYHVVDVGHKVVGVGSVGLLAFVLLLQGRDENDLLVLQVKQAVESVLEPFTATSQWQQHGERVVAGQRLIQAATDAFLGFVQGPHGRSYYVRQLRDMKWGPDPMTMGEDAFRAYARLCGLTLARAHARSGDAVQISAYLGQSNTFAEAITTFSAAYTKQNERDFTAFAAAVSPSPPR